MVSGESRGNSLLLDGPRNGTIRIHKKIKIFIKATNILYIFYNSIRCNYKTVKHMIGWALYRN